MSKKEETVSLLDRGGFEIVDIPVNEIEVDPEIQRERFNPRTVEKIVANFNPNALGIITVNQRNAVTKVAVDGWHRWEAVRRLTDNTGTIKSKLFQGLTRAEEAQMFLDLNPGNQPSVMDRYRMMILTGDPTALAVEKAARAYGYTVQVQKAPGAINAVKTLLRIESRDRKSQEALGNDGGDGQTPLLQMVLLTTFRAWGNSIYGVNALILDGLAAIYQENGSKVDVERMTDRLREYPDGAQGLVTDARTMARQRTWAPSMAVADTVVDWYNRGLQLGGRNALPSWRKRRW